MKWKRKKPTGMRGGKPRKKNLIPKWIKAVPISLGHGSGILQKKLWRLTSDYCRIRDFHKYGRCVATGTKLYSWKDGDAGHFISYSKCNGMFKFDERNIHLQSSQSNAWGGFDQGEAFGMELVYRGFKPDYLRDLNRKTPLVINDSLLIEKMEDILAKMVSLPEQPEYFERVVSAK